MRAVDRLIVALDFPSLEAARSLVEQLGAAVARYKVGLELFAAEGPRAVEKLVADGRRVFLDLKIHDIPETAYRAARAAASHGVDLLTVHAAGGHRMLARAVEGARAGGAATEVLAVTLLTSLDEADLRADGLGGSPVEVAVRRARLAEAAGCDGVIASPREVSAIRQVVSDRFLVVTPGVRAAPSVAVDAAGGRLGSAAGDDDQKRVATAREARAAGADAVVVGRPIRDAVDPRAAVAALLLELA